MTSRALYELVPCECGRMHGIRALPASRSASAPDLATTGGGDSRDTAPTRTETSVTRRLPGSPEPATGNRSECGEPPVAPVPRERSETLAGHARHDRGTGSIPRSGPRAGHRPSPVSAGQRGALTGSEVAGT